MLMRNDGFSLIEILVAVAILAILSAALSPMVVKYVRDGRVARAQSDAQSIATAVQAFNLDTGRWPVSDDGNLNDTAELDRMVSLDAATLAGATLPPGCAGVPGNPGRWGNTARAGSLDDFLVRNQDADTNPLYGASQTPAITPGWNGPYLNAVPTDPWGNPYVINIRYFDDGGRANTATSRTHAVFVLSAGPDTCWSTTFNDATALASDQLGGDDVGSIIEGNAL